MRCLKLQPHLLFVLVGVWGHCILFKPTLTSGSCEVSTLPSWHHKLARGCSQIHPLLLAQLSLVTLPSTGTSSWVGCPCALSHSPQTSMGGVSPSPSPSFTDLTAWDRISPLPGLSANCTEEQMEVHGLLGLL